MFVCFYFFICLKQPDKQSSIGVLANAIAKLEANPMPMHTGSLSLFVLCSLCLFICLFSSFFYLSELFRGTASWLLSEFPLLERFFIANFWAFGPLLGMILSGQPASNAVMRTTTAVTMIK